MNSITSDSFSAFSCPGPRSTSELLRPLARDQYEAVAETLISLYGDRLEDSGDDVVDMLHASIDRARNDFETCWSPGIGYALRALRTGNERLLRQGVSAMLLHAAARGMAGRWSMRFEQPVRLLIDDVLLPETERVDVESDSTTTTVQLTRGTQRNHVVIGHRQRGSGHDSVTGALMPIVAYPGGEFTVLSPAALEPFQCHEDGLPEPGPEELRPMREAMQLLRDVSPGYLTWVAAVARRIVLVRMPEDRMSSGTLEGHFGLSYLSVTPKPLVVAEMLVHESSHQYYELVARVGPTTDPAHTNEYYSPFPRKMRPLDRLLLAYHAFANVVHFYRECIAHGICRPSKLEESNLLQEVRQVESILHEQRAHLTPLGRDLFEPLYMKGRGLCEPTSQAS